MKIIIINGPNLNLLGTRETELYGKRPFQSYFEELQCSFSEVELEYFQSNVEGEIINMIHEVGFAYDGIVLNAGGYTHTSVAIRDAIKAVSAPVIEVHITNVFSREAFRCQSMISPVCIGVISGFGLQSYDLAITALAARAH